MSRNQKRGPHVTRIVCGKMFSARVEKGCREGARNVRSSIIDHRYSRIRHWRLEIRSEERRGRGMLRIWAPSGVASPTTEYM
jgi:hypothetical protein